MQIGLFTPVFNKLSFEQLLAELKRYPAIRSLELGTGGWPGGKHLDLDGLLSGSEKRKAFRSQIADAGLTISALSCHSNPVHPLEAVAERDDEVLRKTLRLAELLDVPAVVTFSGCPGGGPEDKTPNWITAAWPPEYARGARMAMGRAADPVLVRCGINSRRTAVFVWPSRRIRASASTNPETMLRLRAEAGEFIGINLDPSHLWWQGIDIPTAIAALGDAIFHVHAKDVAIDPANRNRNGVLDTKSYAQMRERSWLFRSVGWGHGELEWKAIVSALRLAGYDGVLSIEHEDALASVYEGLSSAVAMLSRVVLREPAVEAWWL